MEPAASSEIDTAWDAEIRERIARYDAGGVRSIPVDEVFAEVGVDDGLRLAKCGYISH